MDSVAEDIDRRVDGQKITAENSAPTTSGNILDCVGSGGTGRSQKNSYVKLDSSNLDSQYIPERPKKIFPFDAGRRSRSFTATVTEIIEEVTRGLGPVRQGLTVGREIPLSTARPVLELLANVKIDGRRVPDLAEWQAWARDELARLDQVDADEVDRWNEWARLEAQR